MRKKIIISFLLLLFTGLIFSKVNAEDIVCDYEKGLQIFYKNGNVGYNYNNLKNNWYSYSILWDVGVDMYTEEEIVFNQEDFKETLDNYVCPGSVYLCEHTKWGIEMPSLYNLGNTVGTLITSVIDAVSANAFDLTQYYNNKEQWSLFMLGKKELNIMGLEKYEKEIQGWLFEFIMGENMYDGAHACELWDGTAVGQQVVDIVCGLGWSVGGTVWDLVISDDAVLLGLSGNQCYRFDYPKDGPYTPINTSCPIMSKNYENLKQYVKDYNNCKDDYKCKIEKKKLINDKTDTLRKQCDSILSNYSYKETQKECIDKCLAVTDELNKINDDNNRTCGFSDKLIIYISNIVKWGKYLLPIIVIVLGILDFIKAIASDKDDEMKKAQGNFVKRLIAAALIFIIPFIIEFVLGKMGFDSNGCGIIDL